MKKLLFLFVVCFLMFSASVYAQQVSKSVSKHMFTSTFAERDATGAVRNFKPVPGDNVYHSAEVVNMKDDTVHVVWFNNGRQIKEERIVIGGNLWRLNTHMPSEHFREGDVVKVEIRSADGKLLSSDVLDVN